MTAKEIITQVEDLPVLSETARKLPGLLTQPDVHRDELVCVLCCDAVLTAKLLRICNSAHAGLREPVTSMDQAVFLLGHDAILRMACALCYGDAMGLALPGYASEAHGLWRHSLTTGFAAESLATNDFHSGIHPSTAFTAGLLHDIGKLVLSQVLTHEVQNDIRVLINRKGISRAEAEKEILGADHSDVGACLLRDWRLPESIVEAVANHHHPVSNPAPGLSAVVHVANNVVHLIGSAEGWEDHAIRVDQGTVQKLSLKEGQLEQMILRVYDLIPQIEQWMAVE